MRSPHHLIAPLVALVLSCVAWGGVWFLFSAVNAAAATHTQTQASVESASARNAAKARMRALALDTADKRARLVELVHVDVIAAAKLIESVGPAAHVSLKVSSASEEQANLGSTSGHPLRAVGFSIDAVGSFADIIKAAELIDTLPLPIVSQQFDILQLPSDPSGKSAPQWQLTERIRLFTDNALSS